MLNKKSYFNPQQVSRNLPEANLDKWFEAYEDMWRLIKAGHTQAEVISNLAHEWDDGEAGKFLQWVRFYEGEDDKRYAFDVHSGFLKVAAGTPGISMRNFDLQGMVKEYKKKMFSRLKALRSLIEEAVFKLPEDLVMDHNQASRAANLITELSSIVTNLQISRASTASVVTAQLKTIEDLMCRIGIVISHKTNPLYKIAGTTNKQEILNLLQSAHKSFVEKPNVRELALAFARDSLGQFPDIGQALAKMIEAHNYVTPRLEEIMSNISVQLGTEHQMKPSNDSNHEESRKDVNVPIHREENEHQDIQVKMPDGSHDMPRISNR